ncbi:proline-rich protein 2-like, partial [Oxyura jamaicensis]|uniref:proline-rich protein 2-like n=1 Tax=Oxyura jamaicensis TaxID=8884 RepID=UPI0015A6EC69
MNGTANLTPAGRGHYGSAIPVPRAVPPSKQPAAAPPARQSTPGPPASHQASSPRLASGPKSLKPKPRATTGHEPAGDPSPSVPPRGGQRLPVPPGKWPEVGKGVAGGRGAGVESGLRGPGGRRPLSCSVRGPGATPEMAAEDAPPVGSQSRVPVFGSGAISFSSASPHSRPVTATVAPFQYRLQEDGEERATSPCDTSPAKGPDPKPGALSESLG